VLPAENPIRTRGDPEPEPAMVKFSRTKGRCACVTGM
jgi:hypothetical protein